MSLLKRILKPKQQKTGIIFIVEDNPSYAKILESYLRVNLPKIKEVKIFPVGELSLMELHHNPDFIVMDQFLDSRFNDAETGIMTIKKIKKEKPNMKIILLSNHNHLISLDTSIAKNCTFVKKGDDAYKKIVEIINGI